MATPTEGTSSDHRNRGAASLAALVALLLACTPAAPAPPPRPAAESSPPVAGTSVGSASPSPAVPRPPQPTRAAAASPSPSPTARPAAYDLAFVRDGSIWLARLDGAALRLTRGGPDSQPRWSPDGGRVVFVRGSGGDAELYTIGGDGSGLRRLTNDRLEQDDPRWSPRGDQIAFVQPRDTNGNGTADAVEDAEIWLVPSGGGAPRTLTSGFDPAWSPDGSRLTFASNGVRQGGPPAGATRNGIAELELASRTRRELLGLGAVPQNLESSLGFPFRPGTFRVRAPSWSPDGRRLSISADGHTAMALTASLDGSEPRIWLLNYEGAVGRTLFARRGSMLAIESRPASGYERVLLVETVDGRTTAIGSQELDVSAAEPAWAPDGQRLAAVTWSGAGRTSGPRELLVFDARGRPLAQVAAGDLSQPDWNPAR